MEHIPETAGALPLKAYQEATFRRGSKTYFNASRFFPPRLRQRVFALYAFVRRADDFVDSQPQDVEGFYRFRTYTEQALGSISRRSYAGEDPSCRASGFVSGGSSFAKHIAVENSEGALVPSTEGPPQGLAPADRTVIDAFVDLGKAVGFDPGWTMAFLDAMEADLTKNRYDSLEECLTYMYGSAEVIGLFMSRCMELPEAAHEPARLLGRAMQYINFIRDVEEDRTLGRRYLPLEGEVAEITDPTWAQTHPERFSAWLRGHLTRYREWQRGALRGYRYIPYRYRIPIMTAADMYFWTADQIEKNPLVVFKRKVKPGKTRIITQFFLNMLRGWKV